jgi:hypothetical protein
MMRRTRSATMAAQPPRSRQLIHFPRDRTLAALAVMLALAACGSSGATRIPTPIPTTGAASSIGAPSPAEPPGSASAGIEASATTAPGGFAFAAADIATYYEGQGYACAAPTPSTKAPGFTVRTCEQVDDAGRTRVIGLVTDDGGGLASAFASVKGAATETILAPIDALYPLAGFLGATLGEDRGKALLTWLASHLGDARAETTSGSITVTTHTESAGDHATLHVEASGPAYLDALPSPSSSPGN